MGSNPWAGLSMICYGRPNEDDKNGMSVTVPKGMSVLWIRCHTGLGSDKITVLQVYKGNKNLGIWSCGHHLRLGWSPNGLVLGITHDIPHHSWVPINVNNGPLEEDTEIIVNSYKRHGKGSNTDFWVSGIAFTENPLNHTFTSGIVSHWNLNGGDPHRWHHHNWHGNQSVFIHADHEVKIMIPIIKNGKDKILYVIKSSDHGNHYWSRSSFQPDIKIGSTELKKLSSCHSDNPIARRFSYRPTHTYVSTIIPKELVDSNTNQNGFIGVRFSMRNKNQHWYFRWIGTFDSYY